MLVVSFCLLYLIYFYAAMFCLLIFLPPLSWCHLFVCRAICLISFCYIDLLMRQLRFIATFHVTGTEMPPHHHTEL